MNKILLGTILTLTANIVAAHELTPEELIRQALAAQPGFFSECHPDGHFEISVQTQKPALAEDISETPKIEWIVTHNDETPEITWARKAFQCVCAEKLWHNHIETILHKHAPGYRLKNFGKQPFINDEYEYYSGYATSRKYASIHFSILIHDLTKAEQRAYVMQQREELSQALVWEAQARLPAEEEVLNQNPTTADTNDWCWPL